LEINSSNNQTHRKISFIKGCFSEMEPVRAHFCFKRVSKHEKTQKKQTIAPLMPGTKYADRAATLCNQNLSKWSMILQRN